MSWCPATLLLDVQDNSPARSAPMVRFGGMQLSAHPSPKSHLWPVGAASAVSPAGCAQATPDPGALQMGRREQPLCPRAQLSSTVQRAEHQGQRSLDIPEPAALHDLWPCSTSFLSVSHSHPEPHPAPPSTKTQPKTEPTAGPAQGFQAHRRSQRRQLHLQAPWRNRC